MKLNELSTQSAVDIQTEAAWDAWDSQIEADLRAGKLDTVIDAAVQEQADDKTEPL